jgi:hypothetical protein
MANKSLALRVICVDPPTGLFGLQAKNGEIVEGERLADGHLRFTVELPVRPTDVGTPNFTGPLAHGSVQERFLYLTQKELDGSTWRIIKRIKVHLRSITWEQVEAVLTDSTAVLAASVDGQGAASVPLLGDGWTVQK